MADQLYPFINVHAVLVVPLSARDTLHQGSTLSIVLVPGKQADAENIHSLPVNNSMFFASSSMVLLFLLVDVDSVMYWRDDSMSRSSPLAFLDDS